MVTLKKRELRVFRIIFIVLLYYFNRSTYCTCILVFGYLLVVNFGDLIAVDEVTLL